MKIAVFASHGGSDLQAIIDGCKSGALDAQVCMVISNNADAYALTRAQNEGIPCYHVSHKLIPDAEELETRMLTLLKEHGAELIFLAGYLRKLGERVLRRYENRVFNIHPALLPKYGGKGMYGIHVHTAVLEAGDKISGVTIHRVNEAYDSGDIVAQTEVPVLPDDTPELLAARVLEREHVFLVEVLAQLLAEFRTQREARIAQTEELFRQGYVCAQAILGTYASCFQLDQALALRIAGPLGGGIGRLREVCGAVNAMAILTGLKEEPINPADLKSKARVYEAVREMTEAFREKHGSIVCRELLGAFGQETAMPQERTEAYYRTRPCLRLIRTVAELIETQLLP